MGKGMKTKENGDQRITDVPAAFRTEDDVGEELVGLRKKRISDATEAIAEVLKKYNVSLHITQNIEVRPN